MPRYAVRLKLRPSHCPAGIMPPRRTLYVTAGDEAGAKAAAEQTAPGFRAYAARLDRGPGGV